MTGETEPGAGVTELSHTDHMATQTPTRTPRTCAHPDDREGAHDHDACLDGLDQAVTAAVDDYVAAGGRIEDLTALRRS